MENGYVKDEFSCYFLFELQNCLLIAVSRVATSTHLTFLTSNGMWNLL